MPRSMLTCKRCGWVWFTGKGAHIVKACAHCHTIYWNIDRKTKKRIHEKKRSGRLAKKKLIEYCNECGEDVSEKAVMFVGRVQDFNSLAQRRSAGKPFLKGDFVCDECAEELKEIEK